MNSIDSNVKQLHELGFTVIKNVFSEDEIEDFKTKMRKTHAEGLNSENLLANPYFCSLFYDERLLSIMKQLLGTESIVYTNEGSASYHLSRRNAGGFHKDSADRKDINSPDWTMPYSIIRIGIYLQDHMQNSGGLAVLEKSHLREHSIRNGRIDAYVGKRRYVKVQPGDVVAWYLKTSHAGDFGLPKFGFLNWVNSKSIRKIQRLFPFLFKPFHKERMAIFMSYGAANHPSVERYKNYLKTRDYGWTMAQNYNHDEELVNRLKSKYNLELLNCKEMFNSVKKENVGRHRELPY